MPYFQASHFNETQIVTTSQPFTTTALADITELPGFTPAANGTYQFEALLLVSSVATTVGIRPAINIPTGSTNSGFEIRQPAGNYTTLLYTSGGPARTSASISVPAANVAYLIVVEGLISYGASPGTGNVRVRMSSETNGQAVTVQVGSVFYWKQLL